MKRRLELNQNGVTLVELLVSVALFGVSSMVLATLIASVSQKSVEARNEALLSERLLEFTNAMEVYLTNATRVIQCGCGNGCVFDDANSPDCAVSGTCVTGRANPILELEVEDSIAPFRMAAPDCYLGAPSPRSNTAGGVPPDSTAGLIPRGCKHRMRLFLIPPTVVDAATNRVGTPGELQLVDVDRNNAVVARIEGVFRFRCGQAPTTAGVIANRQLRYEIEVKTRKFNANVSANAALLEGWHPSDPGFTLGIRRDASGIVPLRNLNVYGVHFGKTESTLDCVPNGGAPQMGETCCSGYWARGLCLSADQCIPRGNPIVVGTPEDALECCSHRALGGVCL